MSRWYCIIYPSWEVELYWKSVVAYDWQRMLVVLYDSSSLVYKTWYPIFLAFFTWRKRKIMLNLGKNSLKIVGWINAEIFFFYLMPLDIFLQMAAACQFKKKIYWSWHTFLKLIILCMLHFKEKLTLVCKMFVQVLGVFKTIRKSILLFLSLFFFSFLVTVWWNGWIFDKPFKKQR